MIRYGGRKVPGFAIGEVREDENRHFFDRYSIPHAAVGMLMEVSGIPAPLSIGSHVVFELVEDSLKRAIEPIWPDSRPDGWQNHVGDLISFTGGVAAARALKGSEGGKAALTGFVGAAAVVWTWNLVNRHSWPRDSG